MRHVGSVPSQEYRTEARILAPVTAAVHQVIVRLTREGWPAHPELVQIFLERSTDGVLWRPVGLATDEGGEVIDADTGLVRPHFFWRHCWRDSVRAGRVAIRIVPALRFRTAITFEIDDAVVTRGSRSR